MNEHINNNGIVYFSILDYDRIVYSFSTDFEDIWFEEDQMAIDSGSTPSKL